MQSININHNPIKKQTLIFDQTGKDITSAFKKRYDISDQINDFLFLTDKRFFDCLINYLSGENAEIKIVFSGIISHYNALHYSADKLFNGNILVEKGEVFDGRLSQKIEDFIENSNLKNFELENKETVGQMAKTAFKDILALKQDDGFNIFVLGSTNSGKSAFVNCLLGSVIMPVSQNSCTSAAYKIVNDDKIYLSFEVFGKGKVQVDISGGYKITSQNPTNLCALLERIIDQKLESCQNLIDKKIENKVTASLVKFINYLPKSEEERQRLYNCTPPKFECFEMQMAYSPSLLQEEYLCGEVVISYPISLKLSVDKFTINDTPGHTDSQNGEHFERLKDAIKNDKSNTILVFVTRPDNPSTVDNAKLIDSVYSLNKSLDPENSFFVISHADLIGQNVINLADGRIKTDEQRLSEFDSLIQNNSIKGQNVTVNFSERNAFFVNSYKAILSSEYPEMLDKNGFLPFEKTFDGNGNEVVSRSVLPYFSKNRIGKGGIYSQEIAESCQSIIDDENASPYLKSCVLSGVYSFKVALEKYIELNKEVIRAKKLTDGCVGKIQEVIVEVDKRINLLSKEVEDLSQEYHLRFSDTLERITEKVEGAKYTFSGGEYFKDIERKIQEDCIKILRQNISNFNGITKEQFKNLYNQLHPESNILQLKKVSKERKEELKTEIKTEVIQKRLNDLYVSCIIDGFFSSEELGERVKIFKKRVIDEVFDKICQDKKLIGIAKPKGDFITENYSSTVKKIAIRNLEEREVCLEWNKFSYAEKFKNAVVGIFKPSNKKIIAEKLEVDEDIQIARINANWQVVEKALCDAISESFSSLEYNSFKEQMLSPETVKSVDCLKQIEDKITADKSIIDSLLRDKCKLEGLKNDVLELYSNLLV